MKNFTIKELERYSGIKAHTLRVWEHRYALLKPMRSAGNIRYYSLKEFNQILRLALLNKNGYRISDLAKLNESEIDIKIQRLSADNAARWQKAIFDLTVTMYAPDPESFEILLDELLHAWPIDILVEKIIYPFLDSTHLLWIGNKLYEEHLVVTAVRQKLLYATESVQASKTRSDSVLLFLPDNKQLDLGLLYSHYFLKSRGYKVLYMGMDVTLGNLQSALQFHSFTHIFTYLKLPAQPTIDSLLSVIRHHSPGSRLIIGDYQTPASAAIVDTNLLKLNFQEALLSI